MAEVRLHRRQRAGALEAVYLGQSGVFDGVAHRGAGAVRLHHPDAVRVHARSGQRRPVHRGLRAARRCRNVHGVAVLVGGGAAQHGQDPVAVGQRIRQALQQHHCAGLAADVPVGRGVERMAASCGRQMTSRRPGEELAWFQHQEGAAREREVAFAVVQAAAGQVRREQTGRTCGVHRQRGTVQPQGVGDSPRRHRENVALEAVRTLHRGGVGGHQLVVDVGQSDEHAGQRVGQLLGGEARVFHGFPRGFQQQAVLRIERGRLALVDPEKLAVEAGDVVQERTPLRHRPTGHTRLGVVVFVAVPAVARNFGDQVIAAQQRLPQLLRGVDAAGEPTGHADHRDRSDRRGAPRGRRIR